jgi:superfamily I DNA/RNA helicase
MNCKNIKKENPEYIILNAVNELRFNVGKKLLINILFGEKNEQTIRLGMFREDFFGSLGLFQKEEIDEMIKSLIFKSFLSIERNQKNKFMPVIMITQKGKETLKNPDLLPYKNNTKEKYKNQKITTITEEDKKKFELFGKFLEKYNDEQKHAIINDSKEILCIAGAGTGKTTVLTKRIEFLNIYKNIPSEKLLAITFTRKARKEMQERLKHINLDNKLNIETFNSFSEKELLRNEKLFYDKTYKVINFELKIKLVTKALQELNITQESALNNYYSKTQLRTKDPKSLFLKMINDFFTVMDHFSNYSLSIEELIKQSESLPDIHSKNICKLSYQIIKKIVEYKEKYGLRDYTDQIVHLLKMYSENPQIIRKFSHILVDEYQDVNNLQVKMINLLNPENLFVVGDPRQSIYGWRGSRINYILGFKDLYPNCSIIELRKNYRSSPEIVDFANKSIKKIGLHDLEAFQKEEEKVHVISQDTDDSEAIFVCNLVEQSSFLKNEIFILGRTNKQLDIISEYFDRYKIKYIKRTEETINKDLDKIDDKENKVILSTVHAIKGLEAEMVVILGVNSYNYPCKAQEHPVVEYIINPDYDKDEEELRVLYVAITRAKKKLIVCHNAAKSPFLDFYYCDKPKYKSNLDNYSNSNNYKTNSSKFKTKKNNLIDELIQWRSNTAKTLNIPSDFIFNDKILFEIANEKPLSIEDLSLIRGINPNKVKKFGDDIIDIIHGIR